MPSDAPSKAPARALGCAIFVLALGLLSSVGAVLAAFVTGVIGLVLESLLARPVALAFALAHAGCVAYAIVALTKSRSSGARVMSIVALALGVFGLIGAGFWFVSGPELFEGAAGGLAAP